MFNDENSYHTDLVQLGACHCVKPAGQGAAMLHSTVVSSAPDPCPDGASHSCRGGPILLAILNQRQSKERYSIQALRMGGVLVQILVHRDLSLIAAVYPAIAGL